MDLILFHSIFWFAIPKWKEISCVEHGLAVSRPCAGFIATDSDIRNMTNVGSRGLEEMMRVRNKFEKFMKQAGKQGRKKRCEQERQW